MGVSTCDSRNGNLDGNGHGHIDDGLMASVMEMEVEMD